MIGIVLLNMFFAESIPKGILQNLSESPSVPKYVPFNTHKHTRQQTPPKVFSNGVA